MRKVLFRAATVAGVALAGSSIGQPAEAGCVSADVFVHRTNQSDVVLLTDNQCLVPTPWPENLRVMRDVRVPTVTGVPSGAYVDVWFTVP
jgi:hypothetical protein